MQATGGSTSISSEWEYMLNMGASIEDALLSAASKKLKVPKSLLKTEDGFIIYKDQRLSYQELSKTVALKEVESATHPRLKESKYVGKKVGRVDNLNKVIGKEQYGIDGGIKNALSAVLIPFLNLVRNR